MKQGACAVGLVSKEYALVASIKRQASELASYQQKVFKVDSHMGVATSGLISDARVLVQYMRNECLNHRYVYSSPMPTERLVTKLSDKSQHFTQVRHAAESEFGRKQQAHTLTRSCVGQRHLRRNCETRPRQLLTHCCCWLLLSLCSLFTERRRPISARTESVCSLLALTLRSARHPSFELASSPIAALVLGCTPVRLKARGTVGLSAFLACHSRTHVAFFLAPFLFASVCVCFFQTGPHLFQTEPSGVYFEYKAQAIGARSQSARTYLEKTYASFQGRHTDCTFIAASRGMEMGDGIR